MISSSTRRNVRWSSRWQVAWFPRFRTWIDAIPEKVCAILRLKHPVHVHDVQKLTSCLAALSRFISRLGEKALPLYRLMKKSDKFEWTPEADAVFGELKTLLSTQSVLAAPISKEPLLLYT